MATFSDRLRRARERRGFTLRELSKLSQVDHGWINRIERGERQNISLVAAARLAKALHVSLDYLAGRPSRATVDDPEDPDDQAHHAA